MFFDPREAPVVDGNGVMHAGTPILDLGQASELMRWGVIGLGAWITYHLYQAATKGRRY